MSKSSAWRLTAVLMTVVLVMGGLPLLKGGFYIGKHEGDTIHLAEIVLRMARGEWPHLDFMTPIGVLAVAPIVWFVKMGAGMGHAIFYAQILVALSLLPATVWVACSRLSGKVALFYGAFVMVLCLALVHGEAERSVSISMHYNRWAWAIAYLVIPLVMLAPLGRPRPAVDGAIIGLGMAALVLLKVTYFISLAPAVLIGLLARRWWGTLGAAAVGGLLVAGLMTALAGGQFWVAYLGDLMTVAASSVRPQPGESFAVITSAPAYMGATIALITSIILLRQAERMVEGMILLFLTPGFFYIVYQNWGNDPQWLPILALLAFVLRPAAGQTNSFGWDLRQSLTVTAIVALSFGLPSVINLTYSPIRHLLANTEKTRPLLSGLPAHADIFAKASRIYEVLETRATDADGQPFAAYRALSDRKAPSILNGEELPYCEQLSGTVGWFETVGQDLVAAGYGGKRLLATDLFSSFWLFGDFEPVPGAAPWYYGGVTGVDNADYLVVPLCPGVVDIRTEMLKTLVDDGYTLTEVRRTPIYILLEANRAS